MRFRDCPAAVSGNESRHTHWIQIREATAGRSEAGAHESEDLPQVRAPSGARCSGASRAG
ncbi:hypothetical protein GCM10017774_17830 [Lentzea cavernae]|uniref:Uncharacterized protein n=1 Tax=Lentzea cavernae TaxID=2020703 RepID=A0ABQ3M8F0_9PSEU|nr:hypothetical protein GCM10017774_17830 [Lentzea cavernae]